MKSKTKKSVLTQILLLSSAAFSAAAISILSSNFNLINYLFSSGGGKMSSSSFSSSASIGQNTAGECESANFKTGVGYIARVVAVTGGVAVDDLEGAYVYPNPYKPGSGGDYDADFITFSKLTEQATIEIFNIAGELVSTITKDSTISEKKWDATNDAGKRLASGVYIFYISNDDGQKKTGKFAIVK